MVCLLLVALFTYPGCLWSGSSGSPSGSDSPGYLSPDHPHPRSATHPSPRHTCSKLTMRSHRTTLTQQLPAICTQAMMRHTVKRGACARIHNNLYCGPPVQPCRANPTCDHHTPPPQDLGKSEEGHEAVTPIKHIYRTDNRPDDALRYVTGTCMVPLGHGRVY